MKAYQVMEKLFEYGAGGNYANTCDTLKAGDPNVEVTKVAVSMFATIEVVKQAKKWGAQLLIVHEPTYDDHMDRHTDEKLQCEKRAFLESSGIAIYRFHDHPHYNYPDIIGTGMMNQMALPGQIEYSKEVFDLVRVKLEKPMTAVEFARLMEQRLNIKHLRICGTRDVPCTNISCMFGTPGGVFEELQRPETEILLVGEACEWALGEYARDANDLGHTKALIIMGHIGSERDGMVYTAQLVPEKCPGLEAKYFECGEVYTYTDSE